MIGKLNAELSELYSQSHKIQQKIRETEQKLRQVRNEINTSRDVEILKKLREYLIKNDVHFGHVSMSTLFHAKSAYDIEVYYYKLYIDKNNTITKVPIPTNEIEQYLYPYINEYLSPHFPIKFEKYYDMMYDKDVLRPITKTPLEISISDSIDDINMTVYYLTRK